MRQMGSPMWVNPHFYAEALFVNSLFKRLGSGPEKSEVYGGLQRTARLSRPPGVGFPPCEGAPHPLQRQDKGHRERISSKPASRLLLPQVFLAATMPALPHSTSSTAGVRSSSSSGRASAQPHTHMLRKSSPSSNCERGRVSTSASSTTFSTSFNTEVTPAQSTKAVNKWKEYNERDLNYRHRQVLSHFPTALGVDDWISRVETVLAGYGFTGDNSIAMTNLCRDEVTAVLKDKIESVFGSCFNTNGLGGVLTCGITGVGAGLSHSPICSNGRERYVFFSFPHIAMDSQGEMGSIARPGRAGRSCACGALAKCLGEFRAEGYEGACKTPGVHDPLDPEYSILKQRLARRLRYERTNVADLTLSSMTAIAERTISSDLDFLISKAVDTSKADYAVVTGVQIHNWSTELTPGGAPSLEFVAPTNLYVVIEGHRIELDITRIPSLSPRQLLLLASASLGEPIDSTTAISHSTGTTLQEIPLNYLIKELGGAAVSMPPPPSIGEHELSARWRSDVQRAAAQDVRATTLEQEFESIAKETFEAK